MVVIKAIGNIANSIAATVSNTTDAANEVAKFAKESIQIERLKLLNESAKELSKADLQAVKALQAVLKQLD